MHKITIKGFAESEETRATIKEALKDNRFRAATTVASLGGLAAAYEDLSANKAPDVLVIESTADSETLLQGVDALSDVCDAEANVKVIMIGARNDVSLYRTLLKRGISDYLTPPLTAGALSEALCDVAITDDDTGLARVIAVFGAEGGVGSSSIACNLAWALAQVYDEDVAFLDLDVAFGTAGLAFNLESQQDIQSALAERARLDDVLLERVMPKYDKHLSLLTAPASLDSPAEIDVEAFEVLLGLVRGRSSFVVLDLPHLWAGWVRDVLAMANEIVVVATLDLASLRDAKAIVERLRADRGADRPIRVIANKVGQGRRAELSVKDFQAAIGAEPDVMIPFDPVLFGTAANNGEMIGQSHKNHKIVLALRRLAERVSGRPPAGPQKRKFLWFKRTA